MFTDKETFNNQAERLYKLDNDRVKKLEDAMAKLAGSADLAGQLENMSKRLSK
jgi:hypothetical protein